MSYLLKLSKTGAIRKTPDRIIKKILSELIVTDDCHILELGGGNGEITQGIAEKFESHKEISSLTVIEKEEKFYEILKKKFPHSSVLMEDAFLFKNYLPTNKKFDYIISSIPLSFHSKKELVLLFENLHNSLNDNGKLIILFHAHWLIKTLKIILGSVKLHKFLTIPPYYLIIYKR